MNTPSRAADVIAEADDVLNVWLAHPEFTMKDLTPALVQKDRDELLALLAELKRRENEMTPLRNRRDDLAAKIKTICTQARSGIKGYFGADSSEYELAGGTRASERKRAGPRAKPTTPTDK